MEIREAQPTDSKSWAAMRLKLWPGSLDQHLLETTEYFSGESIDILKAYVLADTEGALVGFLEINIRNFAEGSRSPKVPYVEAWFVEQEYRGKGFGQKLMACAERWAKQQGYSELASDTEVTNERSIRLHKQLGFKETERVVCFLKQLS